MAIRQIRLKFVDLGLLALDVALAVAIVAVLRHPRNCAFPPYSNIEIRAGLDRLVNSLIAEGTTLDDVLHQLSSKTGTEIAQSSYIASRPRRSHVGSNYSRPGMLGWKAPIHARLHHVSLAAALDVILPQAASQFMVPLAYAPRDDGSILIGADDEMPQVVRVYDIRDLLDRVAGPDLYEPAHDPADTYWGLATITSPADRLRFLLAPMLHLPAWDDNKCWVEISAGRLIVVQNEMRQRQMADTLAALRMAERDRFPVLPARYRPRE